MGRRFTVCSAHDGTDRPPADGHSHCGNKTGAFHAAVQSVDSEDSALGGVIGGFPRVLQRLRAFKHLRSEFGRVV
jgi:hypothetical protein